MVDICFLALVREVKENKKIVYYIHSTEQTTDSTDSPEYHFGLDLAWPDLTRRPPKIVVRNSGKKQEEVYVASPLCTPATPFLPGI